MNIYRDCDVKQLLAGYLLSALGKGCPERTAELLALESTLRKAVIREASVGVGTCRRAGDAPLPDAPQMFVPWETKDGDYDLIPKETP